MFYITQGSYDGAEICELVWFYLLNRLSTVIDKSSDGLYRDDWIAAINNANGPELYRIRKDIIALFKEQGLSITIEKDLIETDFWDVIFNLAQRNTLSDKIKLDKRLVGQSFGHFKRFWWLLSD